MSAHGCKSVAVCCELNTIVGYHDKGHPNQGTKTILKRKHMLGNRAHEGLQPPSNLEERKGLKEAQHAAHVHSAALHERRYPRSPC